MLAAVILLATVYLFAQFSGTSLCNCNTADKFDPTKPGVHHK